MLKVVVVLATANAFLAPVTQRPATIMQAATIAAKDVSALRKASGASQCTHEEVPSIATVWVCRIGGVWWLAAARLRRRRHLLAHRRGCTTTTRLLDGRQPRNAPLDRRRGSTFES